MVVAAEAWCTDTPTKFLLNLGVIDSKAGHIARKPFSSNTTKDGFFSTCYVFHILDSGLLFLGP
jgi:hypothetical protein